MSLTCLIPSCQSWCISSQYRSIPTFPISQLYCNYHYIIIPNKKLEIENKNSDIDPESEFIDRCTALRCPNWLRLNTYNSRQVFAVVAAAAAVVARVALVNTAQNGREKEQEKEQEQQQEQENGGGGRLNTLINKDESTEKGQQFGTLKRKEIINSPILLKTIIQ